jgi:hypothetical protein
MSRGDPGDGRESYEVRINGLLGPLLLKAVPHAAVSQAPGHTLLVTGGQDGADLLDVLQMLVDIGAEVDSVREIDSTDDTAGPV